MNIQESFYKRSIGIYLQRDTQASENTQSDQALILLSTKNLLQILHFASLATFLKNNLSMFYTTRVDRCLKVLVTSFLHNLYSPHFDSKTS